jgi:hypothetical protein
MAKRRVGKRTVGRRRNGFKVADSISQNMEREVLAQNAKVDAATNRSDKARNAIVSRGLFGGVGA